MKVAIFYHCWTPGAWQRPYNEFWEAVAWSGMKPVRSTVSWSEAGSEAPTINRVLKYAQANDGAVLYAHTKGAYENTDFRARWRRSMTNRVVGRWRENLAHLEAGVDAVGCHWLTEAEYGADMFGQTHPPFFGGNFWMARCDYLRTLPACPPEPRWEAERWIGLNDPTVVDLLPGWPHDNRWPELCG